MSDVRKDLQVIQDALDTAADQLLPDRLYGPMFGKADTAVANVRRFIAKYLSDVSSGGPTE